MSFLKYIYRHPYHRMPPALSPCRQGLLEAPKPKVKISNLMRVLGEQATLDPTAIEQEVSLRARRRSRVTAAQGVALQGGNRQLWHVA